MKIEDESGDLHFVEVAILSMRSGNTLAYLKTDQDYPYKFMEKTGTHYSGRRVHSLYFMQFETDMQLNYHIEKSYSFNKPPHSVRLIVLSCQNSMYKFPICIPTKKQYVIKQSDDFKTCMALRSLSTWMKLEDVQSLKIDDIYNQIMSSKVNVVGEQ